MIIYILFWKLPVRDIVRIRDCVVGKAVEVEIHFLDTQFHCADENRERAQSICILGAALDSSEGNYPVVQNEADVGGRGGGGAG